MRPARAERWVARGAPLAALEGMNPRNAILAISALSILSACGTGLKGVSSAQIQVAPDMISPTPGPGLNVFRIRLLSDPAAGCVILSGDVRGTVNGGDAGEVFRGAREPRISLSGHPPCLPPSFEVPLSVADAPEVTVAFEDGEDRIAATYRSLGTTPSVTVTPPADGHLRVGSTMGLSWEPATDDLSEQVWTLFPDIPGGGERAINIPPETLPGGHGELAIPADFPTGPAYIQVRGHRKPAVSSCEGTVPVTCDSWYYMGGVDNAPQVFGMIRVDLQIEP